MVSARGRRFWLALALVAANAAEAGGPAELYQSAAVVTGQGETERKRGFAECLDRVLLRVSGDQRLLARPELAEWRERAASLVREFHYRDRMGGMPVHDEQGTYDRPHDLTCFFTPARVDDLLRRLGSRAWSEERPALVVFLDVQRGGERLILTAGGDKSPSMREAFAAAAAMMAMEVRFPSPEVLDGVAAGRAGPIPPASLAAAAQAVGGTPLEGTIRWSEPDRGWVARWRMGRHGESHEWDSRGTSFDEAFRVAVRGAAQILSGNGAPP